MARPDEGAEEARVVSAAISLRWKSIVAGWLVAAVAGVTISALFRSLYGIVAPPIEGRNLTAGLVVVSLTAGFLAYLMGGYVAARLSCRLAGLHGALMAVFGLTAGIGLTLILAVFGITFVEGVAVPPAGFGQTGRALLAGALPLFLSNLFGGYVGSKFGELS